MINKGLTFSLILTVFGCHAIPQTKTAESSSSPSINLADNLAHTSVLNKDQWLHGSENCDNNHAPIVDIYQHSSSSFIIRQNKCITYEAPFIYVLIGKEKILVIDTGDIADLSEFSLYTQIKSMIGSANQHKDWLVIHTHSHQDHVAGDPYFTNQPKVTLVGTKAADIQRFFGFQNWPNEAAYIELGERKLTIIPTPGHQEEAISIFDPENQWLLTGDSFYPGKIYIKDWQAYKESIHRLMDFSNQHDIKAILGAHIEMKKQAGRYYPIGTQYQPDEYQLDLSLTDLQKLNFTLERYQKEAPDNALVFDRFIIEPMSFFQRTLSNIVRFFST